MPQVSISIMSYNSEQFIGRCLESCLNQSFKDFEICISDDGSNDETVSVIKEFQRLYPGIIKLHAFQENQGVRSLSINGNASLRMCTGKYIAIIDADEFMLPERLRLQWEFLEANPEYYAVSHEKIVLEFGSGEEAPSEIRYRMQGNVSTSKLILFGNVFSNSYMRRNTQELLYDDRLSVMADWHMIIRLSLLGKLFVDDKRLTVKWIHAENVTSKRINQILIDRDVTLALLAQIDTLRPVISARFFIDRLRERNTGIISVCVFILQTLYSSLRILRASLVYHMKNRRIK